MDHSHHMHSMEGHEGHGGHGGMDDMCSMSVSICNLVSSSYNPAHQTHLDSRCSSPGTRPISASSSASGTSAPTSPSSSPSSPWSSSALATSFCAQSLVATRRLWRRGWKLYLVSKSMSLSICFDPASCPLQGQKLHTELWHLHTLIQA